MKHMQNYQFFVITGLSGAGKTSLADEVANRFGNELSLHLVVSYTTRSPRTGETDGKDYVFVSEKEFEELAEKGKFLETSCYNGNFYATPAGCRKDLGKARHLLIVADIKGAIAIKDQFPHTTKLIFVGVSSLEEAKKRLVLRGQDSAEALEMRYEHNLRDLTFFMKHKDRFAFSIVNDEFASALEEIRAFIKSCVKI